jgi:ParB family transcriptional regulator, chromosome partitioning protein
MSSKSKRLGSLADIFQTEALEGTIRKIKIHKISPSEVQPRQDRKRGIEELAESLRNDGLLQPIIVTKDEADTYKIIAGERRFHAARLLDWTEIECKILNRNERETYRIAVIENLQRENLSPYEEIEAISLLKEKFQYTDQELGSLFGKSRNYMSELLSVNSLQKSELLACKEAGIESKNLLIQAVQASKRGELPLFLDKVQSGELKTVKDAKEFNKPKLAEETPAKKINPDHTKNTLPEPIPFQAYRSGKDLVFSFSDSEIAEKALEFLQAQLKRFRK